jgi:hypothetical protein
MTGLAMVIGRGNGHQITASHLRQTRRPIRSISARRLAIQVEAGDLLGHPSDGPRAGVGDDEAQLAQAPRAPWSPHHLHSFGRRRHGLLDP